MGCQLARSSFLAGRRDLSSWGAIALVVVLMEDLKIVLLPCPNRGYISNIAAERFTPCTRDWFRSCSLWRRYSFLRKRAARATCGPCDNRSGQPRRCRWIKQLPARLPTAVKTFSNTPRRPARSGATATGKAAKTAAVDAYMASKEGTHVAVRYVGKGADKTAIGIKDFGKDSLKVSKGTATHVGPAAHTVGSRPRMAMAPGLPIVAARTPPDTEHGVVEGTHSQGRRSRRRAVQRKGRTHACHFLKHI